MSQGTTRFVVHLRKDQQNTSKFSHPMQKFGIDLEDEEVEQLMQVVLDESQDKKTRDKARDDLILSYIHIVNWMVGRYVSNWFESREYVDDMYSEALLAVTQVVNQMTEVDLNSTLAKIIVTIKTNIDMMLNEMRFPIHASLRTQYRRIAVGASPEYIDATIIHDDEVSVQDESFMMVDVLDSLERLQEVDSEEMIDLVLLALENHHEIRKRDISDEERELIEQLVKIGGASVYSS